MANTPRPQKICYRTELTPKECMQKIVKKPWRYSDYLSGGELWYKCEEDSAGRLLLIFTGGQFRRISKTAYTATFAADDKGTTISLSFLEVQTASLLQKLLKIKLPPTVNPKDIDQFMKEKLNACQAAMDDSYDIFIQLCLQQCKKEDYRDKAKVKAHNASFQALRQMETELAKTDRAPMLEKLLLHEDDRVKLNAAAMCLRQKILTEKALAILSDLAKESEDETLRLSAKMVCNTQGDSGVNA